MPFDISASLRAVEGHLSANGYFDLTMIGEPKGTDVLMGNKFVGTVIFDNWKIAEIMLDGSPVELHVLIIRIWADFMAEPMDDYEITLSNLVGRILTDLLANLTLGGTVRAVDFAGIHGERMSARWGYIDLSSRKYRCVDIRLPLLVDNGGNDVEP